MDKNVPTKIKEVTAYHSMGYSPRFIRCPNCENSVLKSWDKPKECSYCNQKLLWEGVKPWERNSSKAKKASSISKD